MSRMRGPAPGCSATRCPARLNAAPSTQRVLNPSASSSRAEHAADLAHALEVLRAAVDVDDALEQRERVAVVRVDEIDERPLLSRTRTWTPGRTEVRESAPPERRRKPNGSVTAGFPFT